MLQAKIKRFTLKATASAVLTMYAESLLAETCPTEIYGNTLAGIICNFNGIPPSGSVTVENGGTVGGILMSAYQPSNSYISINTGGLVSNTSGIGIHVTSNSSLANGISNQGIISTDSTGIAIESNSSIIGGITNRGTIVSNTAGTGILIATNSSSGGIFNSGTISGSDDRSGVTIRNQSTLNGELTNQGLINANNGNGIAVGSSGLHGGISNAGRIESTHQDGIHVSNLSTIQGQISNSGTLSGGMNGLFIHSGSTVGGIVNSGTMSGLVNGLNIGISSMINGGITNTGTIRGGSTGISMTSSAVSGGVTNSGTIQGDQFAINISINMANNLDILGQTARIIGDVAALNTDVNVTNGARFTSEGNYNVQTFNVAENALFTMNNAITVATGFNNAGTLAISNALQTISGDYTQNTDGVFQSTVLNATQYGQLAATGAADLSQSGEMNVLIGPNTSLHAGDVLTNVISGTSFSSPTEGYHVTDNSLIWRFIAAPNLTNTGVNLTSTIYPAAYSVCQGLYCQSAADTIIGQVAAGNALFTPYATLSTQSALQTAASQATPELTNENIQIVQLITRAVVDIVPMWSSLRGRAAGDAMLYQPGKIWVKPYGASMTQNKRSTVNGFDATAYGAVIGKDLELSQQTILGGAFAFGNDNIHGKSVLSGQSIQSLSYQGILYGSQKLPKQFYVAGQGLLGYENNHTHRDIPLYASTATGSYNSWFTNIRAEAGWSTDAFGPNVVFTPEIDASYLFINQNRYQETGSPMALSVATNNNNSLVLGAYGNGAYHLTSLKDNSAITLTAYAGVAGDVINSQPQVTSTFVAASSPFSTFGVQFNEAVFRAGAGLVLTSATKPLIIELNYDLQSGNNAYSGVGAATIKYKR